MTRTKTGYTFLMLVGLVLGGCASETSFYLNSSQDPSRAMAQGPVLTIHPNAVPFLNQGNIVLSHDSNGAIILGNASPNGSDPTATLFEHINVTLSEALNWGPSCRLPDEPAIKSAQSRLGLHNSPYSYAGRSLIGF